MTRIVRPIAKSALPSSIIVRMHPRIRNNFSLFGKGDRGHEVETDPRPASGVRFRDDCTPNAIIEPIHRKAMPVILTSVEECDVWMRAPAG
jgi:hypothetical protein